MSPALFCRAERRGRIGEELDYELEA